MRAISVVLAAWFFGPVLLAEEPPASELRGARLDGTWKMFLADGSEVFRGEWSATRIREKQENQP